MSGNGGIRVGDLVELRSGSAPCLVTAVRNGTVTFISWNRDGQEFEGNLPAACLRLHRGQRQEA